MHGRTAETDRKRIGWHMWSIPSRGLTTVALRSGSSSPKSLVKDGRMIKIGDCALFKSPHDSPPFIGIIHELIATGHDSGLQLGVSWLYRPGEVELSKGNAVSAAPNEVFYSFHRDETPAASLLHPCKVAFLPKGVELPSGVSSFVCRRVYDITNRCLWWLTDKDFLNVHQEEIDKLLKKSCLEVHTTVQQQQGTHSSNLVNGAASASPLKHSPNSMLGGSNIYPCKGRKRELNDQTGEPLKHERRIEDTNSTLLRSDSMLKSEIVRTAERGGLLDLEAVERLVQLMLSEKSQRKIDLSNRSMLAGIIAATDKSDCLNQFVQSKGLPILDEWLKEVHKGKVCDLPYLKESEKSVDDFLFVLLHALDKLPMNLDALQMCNIGKSVNHLRSHKNTEIQKKSRSLVDRWKKRVEAEMSSNEQKSSATQVVSCSSRSRHDTAHGGNKHNVGSVDSPTRNSLHSTPSKSGFTKHVHGETAVKSSGAQRSLSSPASASTCYKEEQPKFSVAGCGGSELPQTTNGEEKSSSSSQSHTNSQCSCDRAKNLTQSGIDDTRSSTARSKSVYKNDGSSRHRNSTNIPHETAPHEQKESGKTRNSTLSEVSIADELSSPREAVGNNHSVPIDEGNSRKIIIKTPNQGCNSPGHQTNLTVVDSFGNSRASSPDLMNKHEDNGLPVAGPDEMRDRSDNEILRNQHGEESLTNDTWLKKSDNSSLSALICSSVNYSETDVSPVPVGDESGMDLLASVAAEEMCRSFVASSAVSVHKTAAAADNSNVNHEDTTHSNGTFIVPSSRHGGVLEQKGNSLETHGKTIETVDDVTLSSFPADFVGKNDGGGENSSLEDANHDPISKSKHVLSSRSMLSQDSVTTDFPIDNDQGKLQEVVPICALPNSDEENDNQQGLNCNTSLEKLSSLPGSLDSFDETERQDSTHGKMVPDALVELCSEKINEKESCSLAAENENLRTGEQNKALSSINSKGNLVCSEKINVCKDHLFKKQVFISHSDGSSSKNNMPAEVELPSSSKNTYAVAAARGVKDELEDPSDRASLPPTIQVDAEKKLGFDLNEGLIMDDAKTGEPNNMTAQFPSSAPLPSSPLSASCPVGIHASVTVAAAAKGPFVPPEDLLKNRADLGWKGSAATSAFRSTELRKVLEVPTNTTRPLVPTITHSDQPVYDFDLNVTDEKLLQDMDCQHSAQDINCLPDQKSGGLELDLNQVDHAPDLNHHRLSNNKNIEIPPFHSTQFPFGGGLNNGASAKRDFDLNDGPFIDEAILESSMSYNSGSRGGITPQSPNELRINKGTNTIKLPHWYSPGSTYAAFTTPLALSSSGVGFHRMFSGPAITSSSSELYGGSVLTPPTTPFATTSFHYPVFPFGNNFTLPTSSLPGSFTAHVDPSSGGRFCGTPAPPQMTGTASVSYPYFHPCVISPPEISGNVVEISRIRGRQGLDLNSGPGGVDIEVRDDGLPMPSRQPPVVGQHALVPEGQPRTFHLAGGGVMKRKEPEGGWDAERMRYKQPSWQ